MSQEKKKHLFKKNETGYHKHAVMELAGWVNGEIESPFYIDGSIAFVPDIIVREEGLIYEVVHSHPIDGKKLGMIQYYCFLNNIELSVYEVSADYILKQTEIPDYISILECYSITL